jgi:hypothetical protein
MHQSRERPGILEVVLVLAICGGLLMGLATLDDRAARREATRAHAVLAERAEVSTERAAREDMTPTRAPAVAPAGPVWGQAAPAADARRWDTDVVLMLLMGGAGLSLAGAGLRLLSRRSA